MVAVRETYLSFLGGSIQYLNIYIYTPYFQKALSNSWLVAMPFLFFCLWCFVCLLVIIIIFYLFRCLCPYLAPGSLLL